MFANFPAEFANRIGHGVHVVLFNFLLVEQNQQIPIAVAACVAARTGPEKQCLSPAVAKPVDYGMDAFGQFVK